MIDKKQIQDRAFKRILDLGRLHGIEVYLLDSKMRMFLIDLFAEGVSFSIDEERRLKENLERKEEF